MKQYMDKSAVIAKIQSLQNSTVDEEGNFYTAKAQAEYNVLCMLENFLDTLEVKEVDEEPVSKDLEEAARKAGQKYFPDEDNIWARPNYEARKAKYAFKEGAEWQKEQMIEKACEWLENHNDYICGGTNGVSWYNMQQLVKDFKKAMEE